MIFHTHCPPPSPDLMHVQRLLTPAIRPGMITPKRCIGSEGPQSARRNPPPAALPWRDHCLPAANAPQAELPKKTRKKPKPIRAWLPFIWARADRDRLLETRAPTKIAVAVCSAGPGTGLDQHRHRAPVPVRRHASAELAARSRREGAPLTFIIST